MSTGKTIAVVFLVILLAALLAVGIMQYRVFNPGSRQETVEPAVPQVTSAPTLAPSAEPTPLVTPEPTPMPEPTPTPEPTPDPDSPEGRAAALGLPAPPQIDVDSWEYILANAWNNIEEYTPEIEMLEQQGLDKRIIEPMKAFVADARAKGLSVYLSSGYRNYNDQKYLFDRKVAQYGSYEAAARIVLPPGTSEHQTGLACDITDRYYETKNESLENTAMYQYMSQHCQEFGFIVRYPADKEDITGVMYEPWHFRYVGVEAATYMVENNLCLEEFLQLYRDIYSADHPAPQ